MRNVFSRAFYWAYCLCNVDGLTEEVSMLGDEVDRLNVWRLKLRQKRRRQRKLSEAGQDKLLSALSTFASTFLAHKLGSDGKPPVYVSPTHEDDHGPVATDKAQERPEAGQETPDVLETLQREISREVANRLSAQMNEQFGTMRAVLSSQVKSFEARLEALEKQTSKETAS